MLKLSFFIQLSFLRKMSIFTQNRNPITGITAWEEKDPDYDYYQEIARSSFADMLHDHERNIKYYEALKLAIAKKHNEGQEANVLDIGTGTGLLSMMAVKCGADSIVACEAFKPIADCAKKIIEKNGFSEKIKVIHKRSNKLTVGQGGDLTKRANILVTEVFDTELIGEGALSTFIHANEFLLEENSIVVPNRGTIWAQIVESPLVSRWNRAYPIKDPLNNENLIVPPKLMLDCSGAPSLHDVQLSQLPTKTFIPLSLPQPVFKFDWRGKNSLKLNESNNFKVKAIASGIAHAVFIWWDLEMDIDGQILLSCAPVWEHPDLKTELVNVDNYSQYSCKIPWRDHWMQSIYYFPQDLTVKSESEVYLTANHDEYSLWFSLNNNDSFRNVINESCRPVCECFVHLAYAKTRIGQWNDVERNSKYLKSLITKLTPNSACLCLNDGSLISLAIAKLGVKQLFLLESNSLSRKAMKMFINQNNLSNVKILESVDDLPSAQEVDLIFAEPYYVTSLLPWDNLHFWYLISKYPRNVPRMPEAAVIRGVAVEFKDLQKIRQNLGICEGFDLRIFDDLVQSSSTKTDSAVEAQPLWEYPGKALSLPFTLAEFNFYDNVYEQAEISNSQNICIKTDGTCNGIALWVDWQISNSVTVSSGPTKEIIPSDYVTWDMHTRQGVHLFVEVKKVSKDSVLKSEFKFDPQEGVLKFYFNWV